MERQPETTLFNPELLDWVLEPVADRATAANLRRKIIHACQIAEQKDASATEKLRHAETLISEADEKSRLLEDERNALAEDKEKVLRDAKQLTRLPETVTTLTSTVSSALKETQEGMAKSLHKMSDATKSHQNSVDFSSGQTSMALQDIKAVGESIEASLSEIKQNGEHGLKPEHIAKLTQSFTDSVKTLTESIEGIPASVRAGLNEEMTLETFLKPFELRDKLTHKEEELTRSEEANQRLINQLTALQGSKAQVDLLLQQEEERVVRRNELVRDLKSQLEKAEDEVDKIPALQQQLEEARTEAGRARSLSTELDELRRLYDISQETIRSQGEKIERLEGQTDQIPQLGVRATTAEQRVRDLKESNSNFEVRIEQLAETLQDAQTLHEEAKGSFLERLEDKAELLKSKDRELEDLRLDLDDVTELKQRLSESDRLVFDLTGEVEVANSDSTGYLQQLTDSLARVAVLEDKLDEANSKANGLEQDLNIARTSVSDAEDARQALDRQLTDATAKLTELEGQLSIQETQRSLQIPEGPLGELASMYAELAREVLDLPVSPQGLRSFDMKAIAVEVAPLLFRDGSKENLQLFLASRPNGWYCLETIVYAIESPKRIGSEGCRDHEADCVFVRVVNKEDAALLDFNYDGYRDVKNVSIILQTHYPIGLKDLDSNGLGCLTAVLRRIHSRVMLGPEGLAKADHYQQAEIENPIIRFSWQMFERGRASRQARSEDWKKVKKQLEDQGLQTSAPFEELCTSSMMNHTYWSQNEMRLLEPKMCLETWQVIDENTEEIASSSLVTLDRSLSPDMTLEKAVESSFGMVRREGKPTLHRPREPLIIRVLYNPGPGSRLSFRELRGFNLPVWRETQDRENLLDMSGRAQYVLIAVVRMRSDRGDKDLVRLYATTGAEIIPRYVKTDCVRTDWSIEDENQHRYMLFYSVLGDEVDLNEASAFPEVSGPLIEDDDKVRTFHNLTNRVLEPFIQRENSHAAAEVSDAPQKESTVEPGEVHEERSMQSPPHPSNPSQEGQDRDPPGGPRGSLSRRKRQQSNWQPSGRPAKRTRPTFNPNLIPISQPKMPERDEDMDENRD
ncbi:hypothetical protein FBULB1_7838 [Fusarium bulbicola]|nr:hypothetical protein FBULB1_7838 [Fusarium bulbicola]